jgi:2-polyprenyl-6-methoxyphenol hydroxylase-like FAD-dependent oxidoreductase
MVRRDRKAESPVLVVGAGTTGLTLACELARHGAPVRIVDKSPGIDPHARATVVHSRTLEVFQDLGVVDQVLAAGAEVRGMSFYAKGRRFLHSRYEGVDSPFPFAVALPQHRTEAILEDLLTRSGAKVERETELVAMDPGGDGVRATLRHADGRVEEVDTPWLIGCDGAHSSVRHLNRQDFPGEADPHAYLLADAVVDAALEPDEGHGFLTDHGALFLLVLPEGRRIIVADLPRDYEAASEAPTLEEIQAILDERGPAGARVRDPRWLTYFHIHYRVARHYRSGRTLLAGDAVHIHSLIGGQGMNTGIQDAYNLAWKLALVARGQAPERLLDSYETERRQVAEDVVETTRRQTESTEIFEKLSPDERDRLCAKLIVPEPEQIRMARHGEEIDLDYRASPICAEHGEPFAAGPHAGAQAPDTAALRLGGARLTLYELLRGPEHTLLLFAGPDDALSSVGRLAESGASLARDHEGQLRAYVVVPGLRGGVVVPSPQAMVLHDPERRLHQRYGADDGCLYLIRPDGYVAFRSKPAKMAGLRDHLDRIF